jgi:hypothetical protein
MFTFGFPVRPIDGLIWNHGHANSARLEGARQSWETLKALAAMHNLNALINQSMRRPTIR